MPEQAPKNETIVIRKLIAATQEEVFQAWTDPESMRTTRQIVFLSLLPQQWFLSLFRTHEFRDAFTTHVVRRLRRDVA